MLIDLSNITSVPNLSNTYSIYDIPAICKILVPNTLLEEFKSATNWTIWTDYFVGV